LAHAPYNRNFYIKKSRRVIHRDFGRETKNLSVKIGLLSAVLFDYTYQHGDYNMAK